MMKMKSLRTGAMAIVMAAALGLTGWTVAVSPASARLHSPKPHRTFVQRHRTMTSVAAGYAAYKVAKTTGNRRAAMGGKRNFAQRHPMLTGIGAGMVTHHYIKKNMKKTH
jgi:hypothetical protein